MAKVKCIVKTPLSLLIALILTLSASVTNADGQVPRGVSITVANITTVKAETYQVKLTLVPQGGQPMTETVVVQAGEGAPIVANKRFDLKVDRFTWQVEVSSQQGRLIMALNGGFPPPVSEEYIYTRLEFPGRDALKVLEPEKPIVSFNRDRFRAVGYLEAPLLVSRQGDYRLRVWVDSNADGLRQAEEELVATGIPAKGMLKLGSQEITSWIREAQFTMEVADPDGAELVRVKGFWNFDTGFPQGLDPWFDRRSVSRADTWFETTDREEVFSLPNPFRGIANIEHGQESPDAGIRVSLVPRSQDSDATAQQGNAVNPKGDAMDNDPSQLATLVLQIRRRGQGPVQGAEVVAQGASGLVVSGKTGPRGDLELRIRPDEEQRISIRAEGSQEQQFGLKLAPDQVVTREVALDPLSPIIKDRVVQAMDTARPLLKFLVPAVILVLAALVIISWVLRRRAIA